MNIVPVTVGIPTKNRYDSLSHTLLSIALQEAVPNEVIVIDDNDEDKRINLTTHPTYHYILRLLNERGIDWHVVYGPRKGQHFSHQMIQEAARNGLIWRIDDDEVAESDCLRRLVGTFNKEKNVGAVAPAVMMPNPSPLPVGLKNLMSNIGLGRNVQWFKGKGVTTGEHLYSSFMYRKGIANFDLRLSTVAHREETIFSHSIFRKGYKLYINHDAKVWHFRQDEGGIRTFKHDPSLWEHDEAIFQSYMQTWGYATNEKYVVLDAGLGDHYCFKNIFKDVKAKYPNLILSCCYPDIFFDEDMTGVQTISIAEAKLKFGNIDNFNIYKWMGDRNWNKSLLEAYKAMYGIENSEETSWYDSYADDLRQIYEETKEKL